jgi:diazepam-binding inhibitor (GABA receptor modulator, acyl-CoA-binding protein)
MLGVIDIQLFVLRASNYPHKTSITQRRSDLSSGQRKIQDKHHTILENFMANLSEQFEAAVANSKSLTERPNNSTLLKIYALYKQATAGDNTEQKPGFADMVGRAKWDAWNGFKGTANADAMQQYIDLIESLD